jgi:hypothetical protein
MAIDVQAHAWPRVPCTLGELPRRDAGLHRPRLVGLRDEGFAGAEGDGRESTYIVQPSGRGHKGVRRAEDAASWGDQNRERENTSHTESSGLPSGEVSKATGTK